MNTIRHSAVANRIPRNGLSFSRVAPTAQRRGSSREDRIFHRALPVLVSADEFGPGGSRDWGNIVLSEADLSEFVP